MAAREIEINRRQARMLGWSPTDLGVSAFNAALVDTVKSFQQRQAGLRADGVFGPKSYRRWLDERFESEQDGLAGLTGPALVRRSGALAVMRAKSLWLSDIIDPPDGSVTYEGSRRLINEFIRDAGGLHWTWEPQYVQNGDFEWCGSYIAAAWSKVRLSLRWRQAFFASTYRLDRWGQYLGLESHDNPVHPDLPRRYLRLDEASSPARVHFGDDPGDEYSDPQPGDILLVGGEQTGYGKHIALVERWNPDSGRFTTLEGNATGQGPRGERIHGVIRTTRRVGLDRADPPTMYHARRLIRPSVHDLGG